MVPSIVPPETNVYGPFGISMLMRSGKNNPYIAPRKVTRNNGTTVLIYPDKETCEDARLAW